MIESTSSARGAIGVASQLSAPAASPIAVPHHTGAYVPEIDGIRALAAALVFVVHYVSRALAYTDQDLIRELLNRLLGIGYLGVELFFVLSGYLVYGLVATRSGSTMLFLKRRAIRILPVFWAVLAVYVAAGAFMPSIAKVALPADLGLLAGNIVLLPGVYSVRAIVTVSWSLSFESHYYAFLGLCNRMRVSDWSRRNRILGIIGLQISVLLLSEFRAQVIQFTFFIAGMVGWEIANAMQSRRLGAPIGASKALALLVAGLAVRGVVLSNDQKVVELYPVSPVLLSLLLVAAPLILLLVCIRLGSRSTLALLGSRLAIGLGVSSYSFYLLHGPALHVLEALINAMGVRGPLSPLLILLGVVPAYAFAAAVGYGGYRLIERPAAARLGRNLGA